MTTTKMTRWLAIAALSCVATLAQAQAADTAPDALIKDVSSGVLDAVKSDKTIQAGDIRKVTALVDQKVMPYVDFQRMTSSAVGRYWRQATPEQQKQPAGSSSRSCWCAPTAGALCTGEQRSDGRAQADAFGSRR